MTPSEGLRRRRFRHVPMPNRSGAAGLALLLCGAMAGVPSAHAEPAFNPKEALGSKIAVCYHPMWLLIDEDRGQPVVGERVPPWGAPTVEVYVERVRRNLSALEANPKLRLNYEWSACELEDMCRRFPDIPPRMVALRRKGQLDFVGGEYSQPHACTLGSESLWRQYEYGTEIFQRRLGKKMTAHAAQETQLTPQQPQILRHFGYEVLVLPPFPWALTVTAGPFTLVGQEFGTSIKKGDEFIHAEALDGTTIPVYLPASTDEHHALMKGFYAPPPLQIDFPDMAEYGAPSPTVEPVLLAEALAERLKAAPPRARGRVHTYWSYTEGVWAEEHLRNNRSAEETAVLAGNLLAMARLAGGPIRDGQQRLKAIWLDILKYQHHDVAWIEVTDLRRKAISTFKASVTGCQNLMAEAAGRLVETDDRSLAVFNGLPQPRRALMDVPVGQVPGGDPKFQRLGDRCYGFRDLPAGGFESFPRSEAGFCESTEQAMPDSVATEHYRVEFSPEGLMRQLSTRDGRNLLSSGQYLGGELRAIVGKRWVNNRSLGTRFYDGDVCAIVERSGLLSHESQGTRPGIGANPWVRHGKVGGALRLSGADWLVVPHLGTFESLTVALWVKPAVMACPQHSLLHTDGWKAGGVHFILSSDGRIQLAVNGARPQDVFSKTAPLKELGQWYHAAVVYDGRKKAVRFFINGHTDNEVPLERAVPAVLDGGRLGSWDQGARAFEGMLDDVRIYETALEPNQIADIAAGAAQSPAGEIVAWWKLDESDGDIAMDVSGKGHHARLVRDSAMRDIPVQERYFFFKHAPAIKAELEFDFQGDAIGDFHVDPTKLNVYYPAMGGEIHYDIPFGCTAAREEEQIIAARWVSCGGLTYVNRGTPKHWVRNGVIANTIAWGGRHFSNRVQWEWTQAAAKYDLRLYGKQKVEYFLIPSGHYDAARIVRDVESLIAPVFVSRGKGRKSFYEVKAPSLTVTSLFEKEDEVWARGYKLPGDDTSPFRDWEIFNVSVRKLR